MPRGYLTRSDVLSTTTDGRPLDAMYAEFQETLAIANSARDALTALFTYTTTDSSEPVSQSAEGAEFELATEFGQPKSLRAGPTPLMMGFPLDWYDIAIRYTEAFLRDATAAQIESQHAAALAANDRLTFKGVFRALLTQTTPLTRAANEAGVPVYALWDGAADSTPPSFAGKQFSAGHTHYLTSGSAAVDGIDLKTLIDTVSEHGFGVGNGEQLVLLVHPTEGGTVRGLRVANGSPYDFIPAEGAPAYLTTETIVGRQAPGQFQNLKVAGSFGPALIIESYYAQPGYVIAVAVAGSGSSRNVLAYRQHARAEYQGLRIVPGVGPGSKLTNATYGAGFGVAVRNRGAAAVMQVTASSTYVSPVIV